MDTFTHPAPVTVSGRQMFMEVMGCNRSIIHRGFAISSEKYAYPSSVSVFFFFNINRVAKIGAGTAWTLFCTICRGVPVCILEIIEGLCIERAL